MATSPSTIPSILLGAAALVSLLAANVAAPLPTHAATLAAPTGLHVQGNQIVDGAGHTVRLLGVDRSGTEYACIQGWGIFDGPKDAASVQAIASWKTNAVRVPLNEDCWLGINSSSAYTGTVYCKAIVAYVNLLNQNGLVAILDLHWNAPGATPATGQQPMADQDHAPAFWTSVATTFKKNSSVIFDLYNEPYPDNNQDTTAAWQCWRNGGTCSGVPFTAAGMQELVNRVRHTGATNIIMLGGVEYANALSQWSAYEPKDPTGNLVASWHSYKGNVCGTQSCWNSIVAPLAQKVPIVTGEVGQTDCGNDYLNSVLPWMDGHGISYLAWTWDAWGNCNALITDYNGTPTVPYGQTYHDHLAGLRRTPSSSLVQTLAIPSYFYPGPLWTQMEQGYPAVGLAIINPNSGPGTTKDPNYVNQVHHSQGVGLTVLGYVYTNYGHRSLATVERDINTYYAWYGVDGIFLDQASTSCSREPYYATLYSFVKAKGGKAVTVLNPGTQTGQCYMAAGDIVVNFEDTYANYVSHYSAPAWVSKFPPTRFWHIVHSTPTDADMQNAIALSKGRNAGWVYVTPATPPNPYNTLPANPYWSDELAAAHS